MAVITCVRCGTSVETQRSTRKYCSRECERKLRTNYPKSRECRHCGKSFEVLTRGDANRWNCSKECAKKRGSKLVSGWVAEHPDSMRKYNANRLAKNPGAWREKHRTEREQIIELLGGRCVVCGVTNRYWLHVDYIPTTRELRYRHPRHYAYVSQHRDDFRVLCANHHYELTLTGAIEGTSITQ